MDRTTDVREVSARRFAARSNFERSVPSCGYVDTPIVTPGVLRSCPGDPSE